MMAIEYAELRGQIEGMVSTLESLSKETATFDQTNRTLETLADNMSCITESMSNVLRESSELYTYVNEISVNATLESFKDSADSFVATSKELLEETSTREAEFAKGIVADNEKLSETLSAMVAEATAEIRKKFILMGGVSIFCSIVALIGAVLK